MVGYPDKGNFYCNIRTTVQPPQELLEATPMGAWVYKIRDELGEKIVNSGTSQHQTAWQVLCLFVQVNVIFLQDPAAMYVLHEQRQAQHLFQSLPVFRHAIWESYCEDDPFDRRVSG
jgi:hypothetical protein